jgi:hypothetical protein
MSTAVHGAQVVGGMQKEPHDKGEKAVGFMVSTTTGNRGGGGRGAEGQNFPALTGLSGGQGPFTCLLPAPGYGADGV